MVRRVVRAEVPADRAAVADLDVGDRRADLAEDRPGAGLGGCEQLGVGGHRADRQRPVGGEVDALELGEPVQVDEPVGRGRARLHHVDERLSAGERAGAGVLREQAHRLVDGRGAGVRDLPQQHARI